MVASPYARKLAREAGVDIAQASGSGPGGRIVAADVQQLMSSGGGKPATAVTPASTGGEVGTPQNTYVQFHVEHVRGIRGFWVLSLHMHF